MMQAQYFPHTLHFKKPGGTSRGILHTKETYLLEIFENGKKGIGECAVFRGLSFDDVPDYEAKLKWLCNHINEDFNVVKEELSAFPSIWFGFEQALLNFQHQSDLYFPSTFTNGESFIKINGLIWMGNQDFMEQQINEKLSSGFDCIKLKIGVNWESERQILQNLRFQFPKKTLEIRVDANGGFSFNEAQIVLQQLADLDIHSIEQPLKAGNIDQLTVLCANTPIPIALDEELIGILNFEEKQQLLIQIKPQYIILKPSLIGGFSGTDEWISIAEKFGIGWWITSALESNIGLNAIAQYTFTKSPKIPQGLGTGALFTNNFETNLTLESDRLWYIQK